MLKKIVLPLVALVLSPLPVVAGETELWQRLETAPGEPLWLVAREEAAFIRERIGPWLPVGLFSVEDGGAVEWKLDKLERVSNQLSAKISIRNTKGRTLSYDFNYGSQGPDGPVSCVLKGIPGGFEISIPEEDHSVRRLVFKRAADVAAHKKDTKVSEAMPLWSWESAGVTKM